MRHISHEMRTPLNTIHLGIDELLHASTYSRELLLDMQAAAELSVDTLNELVAQDSGSGPRLILDKQCLPAHQFIDQIINESQKHVYLLYSTCIYVHYTHVGITRRLLPGS